MNLIVRRRPATAPRAVTLFPITAFTWRTNLIAEWATRIYNEDAMRFVVGCLLFAAGSVVLTQSSQELRYKYGDPGLERFAVRPGISLTVQYGSDHLVCEGLIAPPQLLIG